MALIGASFLALGLAAASPVLAIDKTEAKPAKSTETIAKPKAVKTPVAKSDNTARKTNAKTEVASADSDEKKSSKSRSKAEASEKSGKAEKSGSVKKTTRLATAEESSIKSTTSSKKAKAPKDADDAAEVSKGKKTELADTAGKKPTSAIKGKTEKSGTSKSKTKLADADDVKSAKGKATSKGGKDIDRKAKADGKTSQLADSDAPKTKTRSAKSKAKADPKPEPDKAMLTLASALANQARADVPASTGPTPYARIRPAAPTILSTTDAQLYQTAYDQIESGKFDDAEASLAQVSDKSLVGNAEYRKLFSSGYTATYDELVEWMNQYGDQPMAMKVWNLAKRKKPDGAPDPAFPSLVGQQALAASPSASQAIQLSSTGSLAATVRADLNPGAPMLDTVDSDLTPKSARSAYNNGQLEQAVTLGRKIGDHWVAGLASYRLKRYDQALAEFKFVSTDPSRNAWSQSSGAYWAARCALQMGDSKQADTYFKIAASFPFTFYGLLAEARLGVTPAVALAQKGLPPTFQANTGAALAASLSSDAGWIKDNAQARRMGALLQIGRKSDAREEVRSAIQTASDDKAREKWVALAATHDVSVGQLMVTDRLFNADLYPIPDYQLKNTKVDRALVYAFARKESKFNAQAKSYAGAYGLMQLMPATAALVEDDSSFTKKPGQLLKPATNLRIGQKYIQRLMDARVTEGDLLRTIAAYNAGPGPVKDAINSLGSDADSLLVMESIPVAQTRQYVEEVAANYWIYRQLMGKDSPSLLQAASDARVIDATADTSVDSDELAMADDAEASK